MERTIQVVQPMKLSERKVLRVAAYARVSCDKDAMKHSLAAQISYYNKYIQRHSDWAFAGIYADEAYSGTKDDRPHFVQMIKDCTDGKIDRIITKSISRFARNTVTLLTVVHHPFLGDSPGKRGGDATPDPRKKRSSAGCMAHSMGNARRSGRRVLNKTE